MAAFYAGKDRLKTPKVLAVLIQGTEDTLVAADAARDLAANI